MTKVTISKKFDFDAAHYLPLVPADHKCRRMHGHTYAVELICSLPFELMKDGMVIDYEVLVKAWAPLHQKLDHRILKTTLKVLRIRRPNFWCDGFGNESPGILSMASCLVFACMNPAQDSPLNVGAFRHRRRS